MKHLKPFNNYDLPGMPPVLSWNPIAMRCSRVDAGCDNCWHLRMCNRLAKNPKIFAPDRAAYSSYIPSCTDFQSPKFPKKPRIIAVQFMGDLWHENVSDDQRLWVLDNCGMQKQHIFLLLTKRPQRVKESLPDNCWMGTSVHDQESADKRIPQLLKANCKHMWLSVEPILGDVLLRYWSHVKIPTRGPVPLNFDVGSSYGDFKFVACGPETGNCARLDSRNGEWIANIAMRCANAETPFYDKRDPFAPDFTRREWPREWIDAVGWKGATK